MADAVKCTKPKCGGMVGRIKVNPRSKQRFGNCLKCGRLVNLGKAEETNTPKAAEPKTGKKARAGSKQSAAPAATGSGSGAGESRQRSVQLEPRVSKRGGIGRALAEFFDI